MFNTIACLFCKNALSRHLRCFPCPHVATDPRLYSVERVMGSILTIRERLMMPPESHQIVSYECVRMNCGFKDFINRIAGREPSDHRNWEVQDHVHTHHEIL